MFYGANIGTNKIKFLHADKLNIQTLSGVLKISVSQKFTGICCFEGIILV